MLQFGGLERTLVRTMIPVGASEAERLEPEKATVRGSNGERPSGRLCPGPWGVWLRQFGLTKRGESRRHGEPSVQRNGCMLHELGRSQLVGGRRFDFWRQGRALRRVAVRCIPRRRERVPKRPGGGCCVGWPSARLEYRAQ